jgi:hypothetical protein
MLHLYCEFADLWKAKSISHMVYMLMLDMSFIVIYIYVLLCFSLSFFFSLWFLPSSSLFLFFWPIFFFSYNFHTLDSYSHFLWSLNICFCVFMFSSLISDLNFTFFSTKNFHNLYLIWTFLCLFNCFHFLLLLMPCPTSLPLPTSCLYASSTYLNNLSPYNHSTSLNSYIIIS